MWPLGLLFSFNCSKWSNPNWKSCMFYFFIERNFSHKPQLVVLIAITLTPNFWFHESFPIYFLLTAVNADGHNLYLVDDQNQVSLFLTLYSVTYTRLLECMTPEFKAQQIWEQFVFLISEQSEIRNQNKKRTHLTLSKMTGFNDQVLFRFV